MEFQLHSIEYDIDVSKVFFMSIDRFYIVFIEPKTTEHRRLEHGSYLNINDNYLNPEYLR